MQVDYGTMIFIWNPLFLYHTSSLNPFVDKLLTKTSAVLNLPS